MGPIFSHIVVPSQVFSGKVGAWIILSRIAGIPLGHFTPKKKQGVYAERTTYSSPLLLQFYSFNKSLPYKSSNNSHSEILLFMIERYKIGLIKKNNESKTNEKLWVWIPN